VVDRARAGEPVALRSVRDAAAALGTCLAGFVMVTDPDVVVIGGGLVDAGDVWWEPMETALRAELIDIVREVPVKPAELGATAALVGAAHRAWRGRQTS
jgi:glucokinase